MEKINWLEILFWIIILLLFIMILSRIFGKSATDIQIYVGFISGLLIIMSYIVKMNREIGEIRLQTANSFEKVREDMDKIKEKLKIQ